MSVILFTGRAGNSSKLGSHMAGGALIAASLGLLGYLMVGRGMHEHDNTQTAGLAGVVILAVLGLFTIARALLSVASLRYKVDDSRVEVERGLLMKKIDNLELWRVRDLRFRQGLLQRMLGLGDIELDTTDESDHILFLGGLPDARNIYERLRDAVDTSRKAKGVLAIEGSGEAAASR